MNSESKRPTTDSVRLVYQPRGWLVESYRSDKGPRQRKLLYWGEPSLPFLKNFTEGNEGSEKKAPTDVSLISAINL